MTFKPEYLGGCEAAKIAPLLVPYLTGRCLDIGSGPGKVWPRVTGIDIQEHHGRPITDLTMDGTKLDIFGDASVDGVFSSFLLDRVPGDPVTVLKEWWRVIKLGGYLTLYLPHGDHFPKINSEGADPEHRRDLRPDDMVDLMKQVGSWTMLENETRTDDEEYAFFQVFRKETEGHQFDLWQRNPDGRKRALVIRMGAIGDSIVTASVFPKLKELGYHVTVNCTPDTQNILLHDPYVDQWLVQTTDFVPNDHLGPYWDGIAKRYDHVVNLCESIEGLLLTLPGRVNHAYSDGARRRLYDDINYLEHTHNIADVDYDFRNARFHPTEYEQRWARATRKQMDGPVICWTINGSSVHKVYPWVQVVAKWLLERTPVHIVLYADPAVGQQLQDGIIECLKNDGCDMSRVHGIAGKWKIRQSLAFAQVADCMIGGETGPLNAMAMESLPKVIYLSHSSAANLTKHWINTTTLEPDREKAKCWPCHRLHHTWEYCFKDDQTGAAVCASSIKPERIFEAIALAVGGTKL